MKYKNPITILVVSMAILSVIACLFGLFSSGGSGQYEYNSINNETVTIYGTGLYKNDSVSTVAQGKASDFVTLIFAIPLLLISLYLTRKNSFKGRLLLTGTIGYFLYTYISYTFLWMYNKFFLVYVIIMSLSLYSFILSMMSFDTQNISRYFKKSMPIKLLGSFQIFLGFIIAMLWLGRIAPSIISGSVPDGLEHYTTLVIQGMDLGIVVPTAFLSGILLIKRKPFGYLLSSVIVLKLVTMLTCISAMIINMAINSVDVSIPELIIFPSFNIFAILGMIILLRNTESKPQYS